MSVDPHNYSAGPASSNAILIPPVYQWGSSGAKLSQNRVARKQHVSPCLYPSISNTHHGKGQQSCNCHCSSASQHWRDTKSTRIYSNHLYPLSMVAESQMWSTSEHKGLLQCFSFVTSEAKQRLCASSLFLWKQCHRAAWLSVVRLLQ